MSHQNLRLGKCWELFRATLTAPATDSNERQVVLTVLGYCQIFQDRTGNVLEKSLKAAAH